MNDSPDDDDGALTDYESDTINMYLSTVAAWVHASGQCSCSTGVVKPFSHYLRRIATDDDAVMGYCLYMLDLGYWLPNQEIDLEAVQELAEYLAEQINAM